MQNENYKLIQTNDGSYTYFSNLYGESCHSLAGAEDETLTHYVKGCNVKQKALYRSHLIILEVGFGTGLGYMTTRKNLSQTKCSYISLEIDYELLKIFEQKHNINFKKVGEVYTYKHQNIELIIFLGDARKTIRDVEKYFKKNELKVDCIYQDAFSVKKNAILWTKEWFLELKSLASLDCIMSTYSSSSSIRKSMIEAGWKIYEGEKFGQKKSSTRAKLIGDTDIKIIEKLNRSPMQVITDMNYQSYQ